MRTLIKTGYVTTLIAVLAMLLVGFAPSASALQVHPDLVPYRNGDTIEIVVPFSPGGGFDTYTRLFAPHFERTLREITGVNLNVIVRNVAGAGGQIAHQQIFHAQPDGRTLLTFHGGAVQNFKVLYDLPIEIDEYSYLGSFGQYIKGLVVRSDLDVNSVTDLVELSQRQTIRVASAGVGDDPHIDVLLMAALWAQEGIDFDIRFVHYEGTGPAMAALARGEAEMLVTSITSMMGIIADGDAKLISTLAHERYDRFPNTPTLLEEGLPAARSIVDAMYASRDLVGPPGIDRDTVDLLTGAAYLAMASREFREDAERANVDVLYLQPAEAEERVMAKLPIMEQYKDLMMEALGL